MNGYQIQLAPFFPIELTALMAFLLALFCAYGLYRQISGTIWRFTFGAFIVLWSLNPQLLEEERQYLSDIVLLIHDRSQSMQIDEREQLAQEALLELKSELGGVDDLEIVDIEINSSSNLGTVFSEQVSNRLANVDLSRVAGAVIISDGVLHDKTDPITISRGGRTVKAPVHALITGSQSEYDRRVTIEQAPRFGVVGEEFEIEIIVENDGGGEALQTQPVDVEIRRNGETIDHQQVIPGIETMITTRLDRAGTSIFEFEAKAIDGELSIQNNIASIDINGIRDRLRVLLVSGQPYPGLRVWRNLLKSDPSVDLVHFTILRPPEKHDGTPVRELALIAFPARELFQERLMDFDLVIFDRYARRGLLPIVYLDNIARYVEQGGALLESAGPEFAGALSLYGTPLSSVLPGRPSGQVIEEGYYPAITVKGDLHPVTAGLADGQGDVSWGRWFRQIDVVADRGQVLMTGADDRPLLILNRQGEGRVAQLLSDHVWMWARGVEGGGPQSYLLRRLIHWLMREPELEEERLIAEIVGDQLVVTRHSLEEQSQPVTVIAPEGESQSHEIVIGENGKGELLLDAPIDGVYRIVNGNLTAFAAKNQRNSNELSILKSSITRLQPMLDETGGDDVWLKDETVPNIRILRQHRNVAGRNWIGIVRQFAYDVQNVRQISLIPHWLALITLGGLITFAWWREGRA